VGLENFLGEKRKEIKQEVNPKELPIGLHADEESKEEILLNSLKALYIARNDQ